MPKGNRYDTEHLRNISAYQRQIEEIYVSATDELAKIVSSSGVKYDPDKPFSFDDYPSVRKRVDEATAALSSQVERTIVNGIKAQWELSNRKNDDLVETVTGLSADEFPDTLKRRYFATNESARKAFTERAREGMDLSEKVWSFRKETELGVDLALKRDIDRGITEGTSAARMSGELRKYLNNPDMLFRRVRDERGNLTLSRNARLFHPGQGVYRSSYMNARRLAATETNMAYRSADHERWKNLDFVVGIEIQTSNNHTTKDSKGDTVELRDICDELAGRYPKDFKFVGWHPHCRCIATTILKTEEEMAADTERILNGEEPLPPSASANYESSLPKGFTDWLDTNKKRIDVAQKAGKLPYFLADNEFRMKRHYSDKEMQFTSEQLKNFDELERKLNIRRGLPMSFKQADEGRSNPYYDIDGADKLGYRDNCQTCTVTNYLRRMGFNVEAKSESAINALYKKGFEWQNRFLNKNGTPPIYKWSYGLLDTATNIEKLQFLNSATKEAGLYEVYFAWDSGGAHVAIFERTADGNGFIFDPQTGKTRCTYLSRARGGQIGVLRIDDKIINPEIASIIRGKHIKV